MERQEHFNKHMYQADRIYPVYSDSILHYYITITQIFDLVIEQTMPFVPLHYRVARHGPLIFDASVVIHDLRT